MAQQPIAPERVKAVREAIPEDVFEALIEREVAIRLEHAEAVRVEKAQAQRAKSRGRHPRYPEVLSGNYRRSRAPKSSVEDRRYVPGAIRHWRKVHGLSVRDAQARIGYSPTSTNWEHWERGFTCPPYEALLRIIAATGLGYWVDEDNARVAGS